MGLESFRLKGTRSRREPMTLGDLRDHLVRLAKTLPLDTPTNITTYDVDATAPGQLTIQFSQTKNELPS